MTRWWSLVPVASVDVIVRILISVVIVHNPLRWGSHPSSPSTNRSVVPSGSAGPGPNPDGLPYRNCAAAARDGPWNIHIGDPAYNPALDRNHDGIACERRARFRE
ncbi:excalibur calcium-binding domain-containing protein [Mycobacterium sp.]|uniref:excalibur calcium-binding domain-containing protein n=1 Tax=Mycobacterium sp. TaxID=1785 RepID=UPI0031CDD3C3